MHIENEKIHIKNLSVNQLKTSGQLAGMVQQKTYHLSPTDIEILERFSEGASIREIVLHFLSQKKLISFIAFRKLIQFLIAETLLTNHRVVNYFRPPENQENKSTLESLMEAIVGKPKEEHNLITELREIPFFRSLKPEVYSLFLKNAKTVESPAGVYICQEGQSQRSLFVLLEGRASVIKKSADGKKQKVAELVKGSLFGEIGFFLDSPRTADVITDERCLVARVKYNPTDFEQLIRTEKAEGLKQRFWVVHALLKSPLFANLPEDCFDSVIFSGQMYSVPAGKVVIRESEKGQSFFIVVQGQLEVSQHGHKLRNLTQGDCFGEISLLYTLGTRTATIEAKTESLLLEINSEQFYRLLSENLFLACEFERLAISRIQQDQARYAKP